MNSNEARFLMYRAAEDEVAVNALVKDDTIWLNQKAMAELFDCSTDNISLHLKNIFAEGELAKESVTEKISATASDGIPSRCRNSLRASTSSCHSAVIRFFRTRVAFLIKWRWKKRRRNMIFSIELKSSPRILTERLRS